MENCRKSESISNKKVDQKIKTPGNFLIVFILHLDNDLKIRSRISRNQYRIERKSPLSQGVRQGSRFRRWVTIGT